MKRDFTITEELKKQIEQYGYTFCAVFDDRGKHPNFIYSIAATKTFGVEIITVGELNHQSLHGLIQAFLHTYTKPTTGIFTIEGMQIKIGNKLESLRVEVTDVTGEKWLDDNITNRSDDYEKVYQLYFGDQNNKLPSDDGNLDELNQNYFKPKFS